MIHALLCVAVATLQTSAPGQPPATEKRPVTDVYHGVEVTEDYRWLEDWNDPAVKAWSEAQNTHARAMLDALPERARLKRRITQLVESQSIEHYALHEAGGRIFAMRRDPALQQPVLVVMDDPARPETARIVCDPARIEAKGGAAIDWYVPSHSGELVAVSLSTGGSESGDVSVFEVATGSMVGASVPRAQGGTAGGSLAWGADDSGFFYTRYPRAGERPPEDMDFYVQVYFHLLGDDTRMDRYEIGGEKPSRAAEVEDGAGKAVFEFPRIAEVVLETYMGEGPRHGAVLASVQLGDGGRFMHFLGTPDLRNGLAWRRLTVYEDGVVQAAFGPDDAIYMITRKRNPRGEVIRIPMETPTLEAARTVVPGGEDTIVSEFFEASNFRFSRDALHLAFQLGGPSEIRSFGLSGTPRARPPVLPVSAVGEILPLRDGRIIYSNVSYVSPTQWRIFDGVTAAPLPLGPRTVPGFEAFEVTREFATSKDGTRVPVNIVHRRGMKPDGSHPLLLTGYGGYGVNIEPRFFAARLAMLEQGVVFAQANLRGGGEYGDTWHRQGAITSKQNVFDDFAAVAEMLIEKGYAAKDRLAIEGGSNGGLLVGAVMTQHPGLARCVVGHVGIYDMLRVELSANGEFNIPEFGTVKDEAQFRALFAYSPYHRVRTGERYPPTLLLTGANDPRVDPMQSRKMTARLQSVGTPVWLRTSSTSGHGAGTALSERIEQLSDVYAFVFRHLGVGETPAKERE